MLNKKQSSSLNAWKYVTILPALVVFMFLFQVKVVAQEKETEITSNSSESMKVAMEITKDTKDSELEEQKDFFKKDFNADIIFSDITRNASDEITGIKVTVKDKDQSKIYQALNNGPIVTFKIILEKSSNSDKNYITFEGTNMRMTSESNAMGSTPPYPPVSPMAPPAASHMLKTYRLSDNDTLISPAKKTQIKNLNGALLVINGVQKNVLNDEGDVTLPNGQQISSMTVLSSKEAKKKYGKKGKKGAIEITTQKSYAAVLAPQNPNYVYSYGYGNNGNIPMPPMPEMDMDMIMQYANNGVDIGMKALENFNWDDAFDDFEGFEGFENFESLSPEEMDRIKDAMENAKIEVRKAMNNAETQRAIKNIDRTKLKKAFGKDIDKKVKAGKARNEMEEARRELEQAKEELLQAKAELQKAKRELVKKQSK